MSEKVETSKTGKRGKTNGYNSHTLHKKRDNRRFEAEVRNEEYQALSVKDRLKRVKSRRGESKKETERLTKLASS
jgi:hypothetical protein